MKHQSKPSSTQQKQHTLFKYFTTKTQPLPSSSSSSPPPPPNTTIIDLTIDDDDNSKIINANSVQKDTFITHKSVVSFRTSSNSAWRQLGLTSDTTTCKKLKLNPPPEPPEPVLHPTLFAPCPLPNKENIHVVPYRLPTPCSFDRKPCKFIPRIVDTSIYTDSMHLDWVIEDSIESRLDHLVLDLSTNLTQEPSVPDSKLWTDSYFPKAIPDLIGDDIQETANALHHWLTEFTSTHQTKKEPLSDIVSDDEYGYEEEEEEDDVDDDELIKSQKPSCLVLIGSMGSGKNTVIQLASSHYTIHQLNASDHRSALCIQEKLVELAKSYTETPVLFLIDEADYVFDKSMWSGVLDLIVANKCRRPIIISVECIECIPEWVRAHVHTWLNIPSCSQETRQVAQLLNLILRDNQSPCTLNSIEELVRFRSFHLYDDDKLSTNEMTRRFVDIRGCLLQAQYEHIGLSTSKQRPTPSLIQAIVVDEDSMQLMVTVTHMNTRVDQFETSLNRTCPELYLPQSVPANHADFIQVLNLDKPRNIHLDTLTPTYCLSLTLMERIIGDIRYRILSPWSDHSNPSVLPPWHDPVYTDLVQHFFTCMPVASLVQCMVYTEYVMLVRPILILFAKRDLAVLDAYKELFAISVIRVTRSHQKEIHVNLILDIPRSICDALVQLQLGV